MSLSPYVDACVRACVCLFRGRVPTQILGVIVQDGGCSVSMSMCVCVCVVCACVWVY